jgi:hypothetical protein
MRGKGKIEGKNLSNKIFFFFKARKNHPKTISFSSPGRSTRSGRMNASGI